jgi:amino acid adenylation domain-containing protein
MAIGQGQEEGVRVGVEVRKQVLSEAKRRLLQRRMRGIAPQNESEFIRPRLAGSAIPLSAEQRRVWFHVAQQPDLPIYNEPFTIHRYGSFDLGILEASMNEIVRRHEALRTSFSLEGEAIIHETVCVNLSLVDLSRLPRSEREAEALKIATSDAQGPIALQAAPLFRARVVRMKQDEHRLYLTLHHIIFDAISIFRIFVPELSAIYASFEQGELSPLAPPILQYGDYAIWRERHVDSTAVKRHLGYWREQLSGELPVLRLPQDRPQPATTSLRGSMECFEIPVGLMENLLRVSRAQGVTLYMTLLAAFKVLLFRYSGQRDLIVGSATDARRRPELEGVMGYFLDTFALRTRPSAELRFTEYLAQIRDAVLGGLAAADVPFDQVVQELNPKRDTSHHPIFQAFFSIRPPMPSFLEGWNLTQMDVTVGTSKFVLYLELCERPDHMEARFFYSTDIWDASTIRMMTKHWLVLLQSVCQNPESTLGTVGMLTPEEANALLGSGGWNDTGREFPQSPLSVLIEDQVHRSPQAIAAVFGNERWTYKELNSRANALASSLRSAGVTRGSIVAIALSRSLDLLAGLIAVLKTGAAYLPVDIHMPRERINLCLKDAKPSAILTERSMGKLIAYSASSTVFVDGNRHKQELPADVLADDLSKNANDLEDTAYLIYTSGTTGEPKAVEVSHHSLVNFLAAMQTAPGFATDDVFLAVTPISFDIAALELFLPIISGGTVVIASREEAQDPYLLAKAIRRSNCTVVQATPATWRTLLLSGWEQTRQRLTGNSSRLRVLCGGDSLSRELANRLLATGVELWNMYGPTETTIWSLIHKVREGTENEAGPVSVGNPIANTKAYILDEQRQPLPVGIAGELYLGGVGLAKGYRDRPRLTADRFITGESVGGIRLYRTGDIAVRTTDGTIKVLGRSDNQVKVRGCRVELEAVEAAVLSHPQVAAAAARVWPESTGDVRLSVYVVAKNNNNNNNDNDEALALSLADLRAFLGNSLPSCMIPSDVIPLSAIPLTKHGKVDRSRLPAPNFCESPPPQLTTVRYSEEVRLAVIWADLLGWKHVGPYDNFFDLGGHSLLVAVLQQRIATEFGQHIPIADLFHRPTVRQQVELLRKLVKGESVLPAGVIALQPHGSGPTIFWVHYLMGDLAKAIGDDHPFLVVTLTVDDIRSLGEAPTLQSIAECQVRKILATQSMGPYIIGGQCASGILAFEIASQLRAAGHEVPVMVLLDAPNLAYMESHESPTHKLSYPRYLLRRFVQLGFRTSFGYIREELHNTFANLLRTKSARTEMRVAQLTIEAAARAYQPKQYEGKVFLVLSADRPSHKNFLPGWQAVVSHNLHTQWVDAHHRDLLDARNLRTIADAIVRLIATTVDES